jgi:hypothetical protein
MMLEALPMSVVLFKTILHWWCAVTNANDKTAARVFT